MSTKGPWKLGKKTFATTKERDDWLCKIASHGGLEMWCVFVDNDRDESLFVAITGNGPTSEANARFIFEAKNNPTTPNGGRHG